VCCCLPILCILTIELDGFVEKMKCLVPLLLLFHTVAGAKPRLIVQGVKLRRFLIVLDDKVVVFQVFVGGPEVFSTINVEIWITPKREIVSSADTEFWSYPHSNI
jgi:hypothetical protein